MRKALTSTQVAERLRVSVSIVHKMCEKGLIRYWLVPGSKHRRFDEKEVQRLVNEQHGK